ncbi:MAG: type II toxin-antitoxin system MqsA family antitoxin [Candidatus Paracaedibacteraceae bacterium]|nr:type II toxin-antitoxin system MqsA family antitoxin [Candidatus Paracaedibacteraceae bacterium]
MAKKNSSLHLLIDSLNEVLADVQGKQPLKSCEVELNDLDVVAIRKKFDLSQLEFSKQFGFSLRTLQQWEQGRRRPHGAARILLKVIDYAPHVVEEVLH